MIRSDPTNSKQFRVVLNWFEESLEVALDFFTTPPTTDLGRGELEALISAITGIRGLSPERPARTVGSFGR